ncbi:hypothetical protein BD780_000847 [Clostridium tetanomorphum]|nr:hypothetical protein [Clostridium tetanomorphum]NRS83622.1 hypothetical protein [Clostridium tetanomorphum]NRZ96816.1 hypothetical protein [Clostridium tetanomorphum]
MFEIFGVLTEEEKQYVVNNIVKQFSSQEKYKE